MPIPSDYKEIIDTLLSATENGRAKWGKVKFGFEISVLESKFLIWSGTDEESNQEFVSFALTDDNGKTLDTWYVDGLEGDYDKMHRLFAGAKRQALGISKILAKIQTAIQSGGTIGESDNELPF